MIELIDLAYVRSGVSDLPAAIACATDVVGLEQVPSDEPGVAHLRADQRHHCLALVEGRSGVISSAFSVADEGALADAPAPATWPSPTLRLRPRRGHHHKARPHPGRPGAPAPADGTRAGRLT
ncbi:MULTISPECIES: VOC family protein [Streptomyces violaceusniger group]|uniref:Uncharacterized protein n=2 Tax=Streptomyces rhizosphaericus TaxID=114699 RepID=A0ABP3Z5H1_9ACTN|nr:MULTISPECIES: hypothetical protein [Streptomyces violaceusniger group]